jgi:hypothetical protein
MTERSRRDPRSNMSPRIWPAPEILRCSEVERIGNQDSNLTEDNTTDESVVINEQSGDLRSVIPMDEQVPRSWDWWKGGL